MTPPVSSSPPPHFGLKYAVQPASDKHRGLSMKVSNALTYLLFQSRQDGRIAAAPDEMRMWYVLGQLRDAVAQNGVIENPNPLAQQKASFTRLRDEAKALLLKKLEEARLAVVRPTPEEIQAPMLARVQQLQETLSPQSFALMADLVEHDTQKPPMHRAAVIRDDQGGRFVLEEASFYTVLKQLRTVLESGQPPAYLENPAELPSKAQIPADIATLEAAIAGMESRPPDLTLVV